MTLQTWLKLISTQLSDYQEDNSEQQFVRWSQELLLSYYNDSICYIASLKPQDFLATVVVRLLPGSTQTTCCSVVGAVTEFVDASGNFISRIRSVKTTPTWRGSNQCAYGQYVPHTTFKTDEAPDSFEILPPVPASGAYHVKIRCSRPPAPVEIGNLSTQLPACKYNAAVTEWVLYRALSGETDTALISAAQLHYKAFMELMGIQTKAEKAFTKGLE